MDDPVLDRIPLQGGRPESNERVELLLHEFDQAWQHYRHLEVLRNQYLNYALSLTLASLAASIPLVPLVAGNPKLAPLAAGFVVFYTLFIAFSCAGVIKIRSLNNHYHFTFLSIRKYLAAQADSRFDFLKLNRRSYGGQVGFTRILNIQGWAESVLVLLLAVASGSSVAVALFTVKAGGSVPRWQLTMIQIAAAVVTLIFICASAVLVAVQRTERNVIRGTEWNELRSASHPAAEEVRTPGTPSASQER